MYMDYWSCHPYANPKSPEDRNWIEAIEAVENALIESAEANKRQYEALMEGIDVDTILDTINGEVI